jgi:hypothetical protein
MTGQQGHPAWLGPYSLAERLGEGGMGVVYRAIGPDGQQVAVKALRQVLASDDSARRRLAREVDTMRRVRSPYVAEVLDADVASDPPYIVTRYVSGQSLEQVVSQGGPLTGTALAGLACGLAAALEAIHAAGVVHRDLKPGNVMLTGGTPVVIDFGIAQAPDATRLTQSGMFMGTPGYLAPEVIEGKPSGPSADVHSWGATVAFAATGRPPYGGGGFETIFYRIVHGDPDLAGCPAQLRTLLTQALARDPGRRPTASDLRHRVSLLDAAALVPSVVSALGASPAPGTVADVPAGPGGTAQLSYDWAANGQGPGDLMSAGDLAELLPPVSYLPSGAAREADGQPDGAAQPTAGIAPRPGTARPLTARLLVALAILAAVCLTAVAPVAGGALALAGLILARAVGQAALRMQARQARRGARAADPLLGVAMFPATLTWSVIRAGLLAPLALLVAAAVAAITAVTVPVHPLPRACAYGLAALVAFYGFGPGSAGSRRPLRRPAEAIATAAPAAVLVAAALAGTCLAAGWAAAGHPPAYWPFSHLSAWLEHFPPLRSVISHMRRQLLKPVG